VSDLTDTIFISDVLNEANVVPKWHVSAVVRYVLCCVLFSNSRRWEDNIKMDFQKLGLGDMDWIDLLQDRDMWRTLMNAVMNLRVP
jgi:hypothetical protein